MNKHLTRILFFILFSITLSFSTLAQSQSSDTVYLRQGSWAIQFGIGSNFTLTSFQGSTIGAKYQISETNAVRGGITINAGTSNGPNSYSGSVGDSSLGTVPGSTSSKSAVVSFVLQYLWYMNPNDNVHFYTGLGPSVSYNSSRNSSDNSYLETENNQGYWVEQLYGSNSTQWAVGAAAVFGVEWFACKWLSLHADYNEGLQYQWRSSSTNDNYRSPTYPVYIPVNTESSASSKGWALISSGVSFGLCIYL
jgi:hypothetical protein